MYKIEGSLHAADMMVAYLPGIRTVVEADMVMPWMTGAFGGPAEGPHPFVAHVAAELERLGLDYEAILPVHAPDPPPTVTRRQLEDAAAG
jgi:aryl-alcohol dehydrogenase-like predicted oxidoreductase